MVETSTDAVSVINEEDIVDGEHLGAASEVVVASNGDACAWVEERDVTEVEGVVIR